MQGQIRAGIDGLNITFPMELAQVGFHRPAVTAKKIIKRCFPGLSLDMFVKVENVKKLVSFYRTSYYLKTTDNTVLLAIHTDPASSFGSRLLLQVHGLAFSDSALNALRPLDISQLFQGASTLEGRITSLDAYIDDYAGVTPLDQVYSMSTPTRYRKYIRSSLVKDHKGKRTVPNQFDTTIYYGLRSPGSNKNVLYLKHLSPHQGVYTPENKLKYSWIRWELRLRGTTAKAEGSKLLLADPDHLGATVSDVFSRHFNFVEPTNNRISRCPLQQWWWQLLEEAKKSSS